MTPEQLREDILHHYRVGRTTGRHILATTHLMQPTMPDANIRVIFETARGIQAGEYDAAGSQYPGVLDRYDTIQ